MNKQDLITLMDRMYPGFFQQENIRNLPEETVYDEMLLPLADFQPCIYDKSLDISISFGYYDGDIDKLKEAVGKVKPHWVKYYDGTRRTYCGYADGEVVSFCLIEDKGVHNINGQVLKIGGPGCVGTVPEYRHKGIGLTMVKNITQILKEEGYDYSYIHYTGVASWYEKLGYKTSVRWNKYGVLETVVKFGSNLF